MQGRTREVREFLKKPIGQAQADNGWSADLEADKFRPKDLFGDWVVQLAPWDKEVGMSQTEDEGRLPAGLFGERRNERYPAAARQRSFAHRMNFGIESAVPSHEAEPIALAMEDPADAARTSCGMIATASRTSGSAHYFGGSPPR